MRLTVVCGADRVVGDSSYCKVMQRVTSCRRSIVQCENSSDRMLSQIVVYGINYMLKIQVLQTKIKYCQKKISFANKNKELQNINETEQKQ